uniref:Mucin 5.1, oligomeric mucus/gel-forming n=1 Tax=Astyanax mexicanus TaxID=7994 RepID=A0A8B9HTF2_ASTMX
MDNCIYWTDCKHNGQVCSTWGNYHFKTYDGDVFQLPSTCNHILTSQCRGSYEAFNIQLRRQVENGEPTISKITMKLDGTVVELAKGSIVVNGETVKAPHLGSGVFIETISSYIMVKATVGLTAMWNEDDSRGLFLSLSLSVSPMSYSNYLFTTVWCLTLFLSLFCKMLQKKNVFNPHFLFVSPQNFCQNLFLSKAFSSCTDLVSVEPFTKVCVEDLCQCNSSAGSSCLCDTLAEYSRQCVHAGGQPANWRTEHFCPMKCPESKVYMECGSPCMDTCSNPERGQVCGEHCIDGCFCPSDTVFDDVTNTGCIPLSNCSCIHGGKAYASGEGYSSSCRECTCSGGQWNCVDKQCPGTCSVEGGAHIITFDGKPYTFHGDCSYVLSKECTGTDFTILGDLVKCGITDSETCLKAVTLALSNGTNVSLSCELNINLLFKKTDISIFKPSSFYIVIQTTIGLRLEIQLTPIMQVYITADPKFQGQMCGLCGNFNNIQADDFTTMGGLTEGTAVDFANTWKTRASCLDVQRTFENPCSLSTENEKYAQYWCSLLSDASGVFSSCHSEINPATYKNCIYDTCNCEKTEDCMCAALSSYVHACAAKGIYIKGWRDVACKSYTLSCPNTMVYSYNMTSCGRSCRSLSQTDFSCSSQFVAVDGCGCAEGTYLNEKEECVDPSGCPCYDSNTVIQPGETVSREGTTCTCKQGQLNCIGSGKVQECTSPMTYLNCSAAVPGSTGSECAKSCKTLDMACVSTGCVSGCVCPSGLVSDDNGGCITEDLCPCVHNGASYKPGETVKEDCNTCTCKDRRWQCTTNQCSATCSIYGDGHYITFDDKRYVFNGNCEYTLAQDFCSSSNTNGTFRVITENIPCGTTGTTCSKAIKLFIGSNELVLSDGSYQVVQRDAGQEIPYQIRTMGNYLVIETNNGVVLIWDRKTSMYIKLTPDFNGRVCGLCGNFDGNANNDFTTRSQELVVNALDFGNSWKFSPTCPEAMVVQEPCAHNPYREAWAQRQCSIINSDVFSACHSKVDPASFYSACVRDACACDTGGDCECFCTAVAAYAEACNAVGVCVAWRTPKVCPLFCDYYNPPGECEWHYKPCGAPCMKTCRNPAGTCSLQLPAMEGCYPECPAGLPFFDEDTMKCVALEECGCYVGMEHYANGQTVPATNNCETWYLILNSQNGETWKVDNCTTATCIDGEVITNTPQCKHVDAPTCESGRSPVKIYDDSGCCFTYSCECSCAGWGGSHYLTFDGNAYTFSDSCSYILVQEIINPNLKIVLDKHCSVGSSFCPQSVIITYKSQQVLLTQDSADGGVTNVVDNKQVYPAFKNINFVITSTGMEITVVIPEIKVQVTYSGLTFNIDLPDTLFHNNTEGLCGTCDNNKDNDCQSPSGQLGSCSETAPNWQVPGDTYSAKMCLFYTCVPFPLCVRVFEDCRKAIPPEPYVESCKVDVCTTTESGCTSLQAYALACGKQGFCVDWRNYTNGECGDVYWSAPLMFLQPNETWQNGCQMCECDADTLSIQCKDVACPTVPTPVCDKPGEVLIKKTDGCCTSYECRNDDLCKSCKCGTTMDPETELLAPECVVIDCNPNCQAGYEYQPIAGQCCGKCVRTSCVIMINNSVNTFPVNETFTSPDDRCVKYKCEEINGEPVAVETKTTCPPFNPDNCVPVSTLKSNCNVQKNISVLVNKGCTSITEVELTSCEGSCGTSSMYSSESNTMMHSCSCCLEQDTSKRQVELLCPDGSKVSFSYVYIESCGCQKTECQSAQRRRRRR